MVRHVARQPQPSPLNMSVRSSGGSIVVTADLTAADGKFATDAKLTATVAGSRGEPQTLALEPVAPGRYAATCTAQAPIPAEYEIRVIGPGGSDLSLAATQTVFIDYPDELRLVATNEDCCAASPLPMYPLLAALEFEHPLRLIWLAIAPVIVYFAIRSRTSAPPWRRAASLACRLLIMALAVLAFAGLVRRGPSEQRFVVFATDVSRSVAGGGRQAAEQFIQSALQQQAGHEAAFIPFADKPGAVATEPQFAAETLDVNSSDPAAALQLAAATISADFVPQVVLLTDGNETRGDLVELLSASAFPSPSSRCRRLPIRRSASQNCSRRPRSLRALRCRWKS